MKKWQSFGHIRLNKIMQDAQKKFDFNYLSFSRSYTSHVEYYSTLSAFCGQFTSRNFSKNVANVVDQWRARLSDLKNAGWKRVCSDKYAWAINCPPCCAKVISAKILPCDLRICPFCCARKVSAIYESVADYCLHNSAKLYTYKRTVGNVGGVYLPIYKDAKVNKDFLVNNVFPRFVAGYRKSFRRKFASNALGSVYWVKLEPVYERDSSSGIIGSWRIHYEAILVDKGKNTFPESAGKLKQIDYKTKPQPRSVIASTVGYTFRYPEGWLKGPVEGFVEFLNASHSRRYISNLGIFRKKAGATDGGRERKIRRKRT